MILKKLRQEEEILTRPLWEEVFTEDTKKFLDYYYTSKTKDNEIYVIETEGAIRSMLHLNPYTLHIGEKEEPGRYIVAVATEPLHRGKKYMTELLRKSARDMYQQKVPFAFLMPADVKIYYPHDFRMIYDGPVWELTDKEDKMIRAKELMESKSIRRVEYRPAREDDCRDMARFAEKILQSEYQIYTKRDGKYYHRLLEEQESENGGIYLAVSDEGIKGMFLFAEEGKLEIREPLFEKGCEKVFEYVGLKIRLKEKTPRIMARVIHVETLLSCMTCTEETEFSFVLVDPVVSENNKLFVVKGNQEHIVVRTKPLIKGQIEDVQMISIDALTSILFGYKSLSKIEKEEKEVFSKEFKEEIGKLIPFNHICLDEIV